MIYKKTLSFLRTTISTNPDFCSGLNCKNIIKLKKNYSFKVLKFNEKESIREEKVIYFPIQNLKKSLLMRVNEGQGVQK